MKMLGSWSTMDGYDLKKLIIGLRRHGQASGSLYFTLHVRFCIFAHGFAFHEVHYRGRHSEHSVQHGSSARFGKSFGIMFEHAFGQSFGPSDPPGPIGPHVCQAHGSTLVFNIVMQCRFTTNTFLHPAPGICLCLLIALQRDSNTKWQTGIK